MERAQVVTKAAEEAPLLVANSRRSAAGYQLAAWPPTRAAARSSASPLAR
jgi:hypothetical protein